MMGTSKWQDKLIIKGEALMKQNIIHFVYILSGPLGSIRRFNAPLSFHLLYTEYRAGAIMDSANRT